MRPLVLRALKAGPRRIFQRYYSMGAIRVRALAADSLPL